ncbi:MAG TPA: hypothetical protein VGX50_18705 [Longimicrobium sp.]|jgi:hypothetical protein|nr:hypothetical protein [Longimicrobium sp.]
MRPTTLLFLTCITLPACSARSVESAPSRAPRAAVEASATTEASGTTEARPCEAANTFFGGTAIADREGWYGPHLRAMEERPLCTGEGTPRKTYRFTWIPAFHAPVVVRVERLAQGYRLHAKLGGGTGGYEAGPLVRDTIAMLSDAEVRNFTAQLTASQFWSLPTLDPDPPIGMDGAQWVLEGLVGTRYHVVDRWSPSEEDKYRRLGDWLLARSGLVSDKLVREY